MGLNIKNKKTYHQYDDITGLMRNIHEAQNPDILKAHGDAIGHTVDAYLAYEYAPFIDAVKNCFKDEKDEKGSYVQGYRSPYHFSSITNTMSRDHILNTLVLMKLTGNKDFLKKLAKGLRWKISKRYSFTINSWFWMKGIAGNKFYMFLNYLIGVPFLLVAALWHKILCKLGNFGKELNQNDFVLLSEGQIPAKQKKYRKLMLYPIYAVYLKVLQLYVAPNSLGKWLEKKICLMFVDKQNFFLRLMLGAKVAKNDVYSYKPMYGGRWTTHLNNMNDRFLKIITEDLELITENNVDVDMLINMYEKLK